MKLSVGRVGILSSPFPASVTMVFSRVAPMAATPSPVPVIMATMLTTTRTPGWVG